MPPYMDQYNTDGAPPEDMATAHVADLELQATHGVKFLTYWLDYEGGVSTSRGSSRVNRRSKRSKT